LGGSDDEVEGRGDKEEEGGLTLWPMVARWLPRMRTR
jgi:hypothetical protein